MRTTRFLSLGIYWVILLEKRNQFNNGKQTPLDNLANGDKTYYKYLKTIKQYNNKKIKDKTPKI